MSAFIPNLPITPRRRHTRTKWIASRSSKTSRTPIPDISAAPTTLSDGPLASVGISLFRRIMRADIGWQSPRSGYSGLIEECRMLLIRTSPTEQQRIITKSLSAMFFSPTGPTFFRKYFAKPLFNARITPLVFSWLVGPCETNRPPEGGHGVFIERCRFLEESGCKGMCVNLCQQPTQAFFTERLGLPVRMTPNYDDLSCQMTFGVSPLPVEEDPAVTGDCMKNCKMASTIRLRGDATCYVTKDSQ